MAEILASEGFKAFAMAATATATVNTVVQTQRAEKFQRRSSKAQDRMAATETRRRQLEQLARMRALRANMVNVAEQTGTEGSSGVTGSVGAITSSASDNIGYLSDQYQAGRTVSTLRQNAATSQGRAAISGAVADVFGGIADRTDAWDELFEG